MDENVRRTPRWAIGVLLHDFHLGGAERVAIRLANAWSRMGGRVIVFAGSDHGRQRELIDGSIEIVVADPPILRKNSPSPVRLARWAASCSAIRCVQVLYLPGNSYFRGAGILAAAAAGGARVYVTITNSLCRIDRTWIRNIVFGWLTRWRLRKVAGVASMSQSLLTEARQVLGEGIADAVLPNALFDGLPRPADVARRPWHLCAVGRLVPQKNLALLLQAFALLKDLPVTLSIAGDGPQMQQLQQLARSLDVADRVTFLGEVAGSSACLAAAEVMVLTSAYEGYPAVVVEALAAGTFVVASNCSVAMADVLKSPELGVVVDGTDAAAFAAAIRGFFAGPYRHAVDARLVQARPIVESHVANEAAGHYLQFMGLARS